MKIKVHYDDQVILCFLVDEEITLVEFNAIAAPYGTIRKIEFME